MKKYKKFYYALITLIAFIPICLVFSKSIWFDESYTLSLIKHSYKDIVRIIKLDMHPPIYFLSLKLFCDIFGYSLIVTKIFSVLGYMSSILICGLILKKHFSEKISLVYCLTFLAVPMSLYFSAQQRSYSWSIFFIVLCFLELIIFLQRDKKVYHILLMSFAGLMAAYNHFFSLLVIGIIFTLANIYILFFRKEVIKEMLISDFLIIAGYAFWVIPLFSQTRDAISGFWVNSISMQTILIFLVSIVIVILLLLKKQNRRLEIVFSSIVILAFQVISLLASVIIRPFYITRYAIVISGLGALLIAFGVDAIQKVIKRTIVFSLIAVCMFNVVSSMLFEYNDSMPKFIERSRNLITSDDVFVYFDNSFGIMSYYYPDNMHLCTYEKSWFEAFENVTCIKSIEVVEYIKNANKVYTVKMNYTKISEVILTNFNLTRVDEFVSDFNTFEFYELTEK